MLSEFEVGIPARRSGEDWVEVGIPGQASARLIEQLVLQAFGVEGNTLFMPHRGRARIAFARQVAIYISHVHLGQSLTVSGRLFGRDRTTAAHACRTVEDRREDPSVDRQVRSIEEALDFWLQFSSSIRPAAGVVLQ